MLYGFKVYNAVEFNDKSLNQGIPVYLTFFSIFMADGQTNLEDLVFLSSRPGFCISILQRLWPCPWFFLGPWDT